MNVGLLVVATEALLLLLLRRQVLVQSSRNRGTEVSTGRSRPLRLIRRGTSWASMISMMTGCEQLHGVDATHSVLHVKGLRLMGGGSISLVFARGVGSTCLARVVVPSWWGLPRVHLVIVILLVFCLA